MEATLADHERDIRQYAPSLIQQATMSAKIDALTAEMRVVNAGIADLRAEWRRDVEHFDHEVQTVRQMQEKDRLDVQRTRAEREAVERERDRTTFRWRVGTLIAVLLPTIALFVSILTLLSDSAPK